MPSLLSVQDLQVSFATYGGEVKAVRNVSFELEKGECLAIVGESGCGKSVTSQAIMRLIPTPPGKIKGGSVRLNGRDLFKLPEREMRRVRGKEIGMIFQDPMTSLNPTMTIGRQIAETLVKHQELRSGDVRKRVMEMLSLVGIPQPNERVDAYPHQFSGGMRQRVMIAIALACNPKLLIADEPTTALDVTIQAQILKLMRDLQSRMGTSIILITHDLGVVAGLADRVAVMYAGQIVEQGRAADIFYRPQHPYTQGLLRSVPRLHQLQREPLASIPGTPPDLFAPPPGCAFAPRCPNAMRICSLRPAEMTSIEDRSIACWLQHPLAPRPAESHERSVADASA